MNEILIHEVGMRDGLQMEQKIVPTEVKIKWIEQLVSSGVDIIQIGSFVHPVKVPQMADTDALVRHFSVPDSKSVGATFSALVLNEKGLDRGLACGVEMFCMGVSASETHSQKNTGMSIANATQEIIRVAKRALGENKRVQVSVQSAFGCGYEGFVPQERVLQLVTRFLDVGLTNISLADTAGHAVPDRVERMFESVFALGSNIDCTCHFHDTYGLGLANCYAAMKAGVKYFESSVAGLGGCPFTKIAGGNVCTEDFVHYLHRLGRRSDIKLEQLLALAGEIGIFFGRELPGKVYKTGALSVAMADASAN